jgi:hypothetical protein
MRSSMFETEVAKEVAFKLKQTEPSTARRVSCVRGSRLHVMGLTSGDVWRCWSSVNISYGPGRMMRAYGPYGTLRKRLGWDMKGDLTHHSTSSHPRIPALSSAIEARG